MNCRGIERCSMNQYDAEVGEWAWDREGEDGDGALYFDGNSIRLGIRADEIRGYAARLMELAERAEAVVRSNPPEVLK
jgi:hypothetical protein